MPSSTFEKFQAMYDVYYYWNTRINVISRKDFPNFYLHHVLHSLTIARFFSFPSQSFLLDVGTGGGFPGIPLALYFPMANFYLTDSVNKKIHVVREVCAYLKIENVTPLHTRTENLKTRTFHFILSRAVAPIQQILNWTQHLQYKHSSFPDAGYIFLKGGNLKDETLPFLNNLKIIELSKYFNENFFNEKKILYLRF